MNENLLRMIQEGFVGEETPDDPKLDRRKFEKGPFAMAGSKASSLKHIINRLELRGKFIDVFGGSGIVGINMDHHKWKLQVYNDRNSGAVNFFRVCREVDGRNRLIEFFKHAVVSREDFIIARDTWKNESDDYERACKWLLMVKLSVLGKGVSFARQTDSKMVNQQTGYEALFRKLHRWSKGVIFENLDFRNVFDDFDSEDAVFYADPPYLGTDNTTYDVVWREQDQRDLLHKIQNAKGFVALSGFPSKLNDELVDWDDRFEWTVRKMSNVRGEVDHGIKGNSTEVLWIKR